MATSDGVFISQLGQLTTIVGGDYLVVLDVSDTSQSLNGTTKRIAYSDLIQGLLRAGNNLGDLTDLDAAWTNLGLGEAAAQDVPTGLVKGDGEAFTEAVAGTDYLAPNGDGSALTGITMAQISGLSTALAGKLAATVTNPVAGQYTRFNGASWVNAAIQAGDVPVLNQDTTGKAANVTGVVAIANGGTGATTAEGARVALGIGSGGSASSGDAGLIQISDGSGGFTSDSAFFWDATNHRLGIGTLTPSYPIHAVQNAQAYFYVDPDNHGCTLHIQPGAAGSGQPLEFQCNNGVGAALNTGANTFNFGVGTAQFFFKSDSSISTNGPAITFRSVFSNTNAMVLQGAAGQSVPVMPIKDSSGNILSSWRQDGSFQPPHLADADAINDSFYYSTTQSKPCYKDSSGTVIPLGA